MGTTTKAIITFTIYIKADINTPLILQFLLVKFQEHYEHSEQPPPKKKTTPPPSKKLRNLTAPSHSEKLQH